MIPAATLSVLVQARGVMEANRAVGTVDRGLGQAERSAISATRQVERFGRTRGTAHVDLDDGPALRGIAKIRSALAGIRDKTVRVRVLTDNDNGGADARRSMGKTIQQANVLQRTIALVRPAAMIAGLGLAVQMMAAFAAGAVALVASLAPLAGSLALFPSLLAAFAQGMAVARLGMMGLGDVAGGLTAALEKPTGAGRRLRELITSFTPAIVHLRNIAQGPILRGLTDGLQSASANLGRLNPIVRGTANMLGQLAREAGALVGSAGFGRDIATVGARNVQILGILGRAAISVGDALRHVVVAAGPLTMWMTRLVGSWAAGAQQAAATGRESGRMAAFFESTRAVMARLFSISGSLGTAFWNIAKAGKALGDDLLKSLDEAADSYARWTGSVAGQNAIADFFERARGPIYEVGRLIRDVTKGFFELSTQPGLEKLIRQLRVELLPVVLRVMNSTTAAFGPALIDAISAVARAVEPLMGASGPVVLYVKVLTQVAEAAAAIMSNVPGAAQAVTVLVGAFAVRKAIGFAAAITGVTRAMTAMRIAYLVSTGAITAETTATTANTMAKNVGIGTALRHTAATVASRVAMVAAAAATAAVTAAQWLLNAAMAANPIGLVILAIAALVAAFVLLGGKLSWLTDAFGDAWDWIKNATTVAWNAIKSVLSAVWSWITAWVTTHTKAITTVVTAAWNAIRTVTTAVWGAIRSTLSTAWDSIVAVTTGAAHGVRTAVSTAWNAVRSVTSTVWGAIREATSTAWNGIKSVVSTVTGAIRGAVSDAWSAVKSATSSAWNAVTAAITGAIEKALGVVRGMVGRFVGIGGDIVRGIANGIRGAAGAVADAIGGVVTGAINKAKSMLGIGSPSKLFAQLGGWVGEGFANGILEEAGRVARAAASLGNTATAGGTAGVTISGGDPVSADWWTRGNPPPPPAAAAASIGEIRVFIGDRELTDMVRVEVDKTGRKATANWNGGVLT